MRRRSAAGFSLIELMIVIAIIMVLITMAMPSIMATLQRAHEAAAVSMLRSLHTAQEGYRISNQEYADDFRLLTEFGQASQGGDVLLYSNYIFRLNRGEPKEGKEEKEEKKEEKKNGEEEWDEWECTAEPVRARGSARYFYIDDTGIIRYEFGNFATSSSPVLQ
ncbi:MAG: type IV pilin protein [Terriglobia bacterium]